MFTINVSGLYTGVCCKIVFAICLKFFIIQMWERKRKWYCLSGTNYHDL